MSSYIRNLFVYFESVLHPANGWADNRDEKKKRRTEKPAHVSFLQPSPEGFNIRASAKKQDKLRRNPAP